MKEGDGVTCIGDLELTPKGQGGCKDHTLTIHAHTIIKSDPDAMHCRWVVSGQILAGRDGRGVKSSEKFLRARAKCQPWRMNEAVWFNMLLFPNRDKLQKDGKDKRFNLLRERLVDKALIVATGEPEIEHWQNGDGADLVLRPRDIDFAMPEQRDGKGRNSDDGGADTASEDRTAGTGSADQEYDDSW